MGQLEAEKMGQPGLLGLWILKVNTRSSRSGDGKIFCNGRKFLFSYVIVYRIFDNILISGSDC